MAWLGSLLMKSFLGNESNPNKVVEVKSDKYSDRPIILREDSMVLYGGADQKFEIVMNRPCVESLHLAYSLFRSDSNSEARERFLMLKDKLPILCDISTMTTTIIQKYCITIQENPKWNVCHLCVYFNLIDSIQNPKVLCCINTYDSTTGVSPLQVAVQAANLAMINKLISLEASLDHLDFEGNNVFHYAATTSKEVIMAVGSQKEKRGLNGRSTIGHTPLHVACLADKPECVKALLMCGADVNLSATQCQATGVYTPPGLLSDFIHDNHNKLKSEEMKFGGTPLHWSSSKEVIDALLDRKCDINALNFDHRTALMVMVMRNRLECVVALLSREAETDLIDVDGNTALHLAVQQKSVPIVQALIVFGADLSLINNKGWSCRHLAGQEGDEGAEKVLYLLHSVGAGRCTVVSPSCTDACLPGGTRDGLPPPPPSAPLPNPLSHLLQAHLENLTPSSARGGRVLCLDGGGIRGLVLVSLLLHLEKVVGKPIVHCFDWVAATSTGAILALALAAGNNLKECMCLYFRMKDTAFSGYRPYSSEPLETILKETLGTDTTMADIKHPKMMIAGCLADRKPIELHMFRNYDSPRWVVGAEGGDTADSPHFTQQLLWEAARASGAAPSYFRAFGKYVDGGLIANNPTQDALTEIHEYNLALRAVGRDTEAIPPSVIVSLGTGSVPVTPVESMDIFWPSGILETAKLMKGVSSMQGVLVDQATLADGRVVDRTAALCSMLQLPYFRFSPQLSENIVMDETSDAKLINMLWETTAYICSQHLLVTKLASLLN